MSVPVKVQREQIEDFVRNRSYAKSRAAIKNWLRSQTSLDARIEACDWYRRLGDFKQAYRTIAPENYVLNQSKYSMSKARQYLWSARMLNLMGASPFAMQIVARLPVFETANENRMIANIHLSNFESAKALEFFTLAEKQDESPESYTSRMSAISMGDALAGVGRYREAMAKIKKIRVNESESLLRGVILQVRGEYLARLGQHQKALEVLESALPLFPATDQTLDRWFLTKWIGIALIGSGKTQEGLRQLDRAIKALQKPGYRAEVWLDCLYWKQKFNLATQKEQECLWNYPGLPPEFVRRYTTPTQLEVGAKKVKADSIWISIARQEWKLGDRPHHSLSKEIELLGLLRRSYPFGLSLPRLATELWPNEMSSYLFLEGRIQQLLRRLRNEYGIDACTVKQEVILDPAAANRVGVEVAAPDSSPTVFGGLAIIPLDQVQKYYQIKRTQAHHLVQGWIQNKRVKLKRLGREKALVDLAFGATSGTPGATK